MTANALSAPLTRTGWLGLFAGLALLLLGFGWAWVTPINGAVVASGAAVVHGKPKTVQSVDGGSIEEIRVANGDRVRAGDVLVRLDPTLLRSNLEIYRNRLAETRAKISRLRAEQVNARTPVFDYDTTHIEGLPLDQINAGQAEIFRARHAVMKGRKEQMHEKIAQFGNQISGVEALIGAKRDQLAFMEKELADVRSLNADGLARQGRMLELQRARARLLGEIAQQQSELARIRNSIRDADLEILQSERKFKEQVVTDLRDAVMKDDDLTLQIIGARKKLDRIDIRAPVDGIVHEMQVFNAGGVVPPGKTIMQIIPIAKGVDFEVRVAPKAIDQVARGQRARMAFPAFHNRTVPEIFGTVSGISPDSITDTRTGQSFYRVTLDVPPEQLARLEGNKILPGMPIEAFLQTGERTVLSYLTRPLNDQLSRAFRSN